MLYLHMDRYRKTSLKIGGLDELTRYRRKKQTRKWCRGKIGVRHELGDWIHYSLWIGSVGKKEKRDIGFDEARCIKCKKKFLR